MPNLLILIKYQKTEMKNFIISVVPSGKFLLFVLIQYIFFNTSTKSPMIVIFNKSYIFLQVYIKVHILLENESQIWKNKLLESYQHHMTRSWSSNSIFCSLMLFICTFVIFIIIQYIPYVPKISTNMTKNWAFCLLCKLRVSSEPQCYSCALPLERISISYQN